MRTVWAGLALLIIVTLAGCAPKIPSYNGPEVTRILVYKESRRMYLMHDEAVLAAYDIDLGFAPVGDKEQSGDGKTPTGDYIIDRRNPNSQFFLSLGISYPDANDIAAARAAGVDPGGDIFIHGESSILGRRGTDWTWGCISVSNKEMAQIWAMVPTGAPISIYE
ncbi:MAG: L,D-transpeptidase family protein [Pseudomonadota bacterium]